MPDITKCMNQQCEAKQDCYRYMVKSSERQSMTVFDGKDRDCPWFVPWELMKEENI